MRRYVMRLAWVLLPLYCTLAGLSAYAQEVYFPRGTPPTEPLVYDDASEMRLVVILQGATMIHRPDNEGQPLDIDQPRYLDPLVAYTQTSDEQYFLVKNPHNNQWGWIHRDFVLASNKPLRDESHPAFLKIVVRNNWRTEAGIQIREAPIFNGPGRNYEQIGKINIFRIRYAYDLRQDVNGTEYVLVGHDSSLNPEVPANTLTGWIPREYVIFWPSRVGVYYKKDNLSLRREPVVFFHQHRDLLDYLGNGNHERTIGLEDLRIKTPLRYDTTRFPVLDHKEKEGHLKVAFVGDAYNRETKGNVSDSAISQKKSVIHEAINLARNRDILFLIDATESMARYFEVVQKGVVGYLDSLEQKNERHRFRFALAIYRDYPDRNGGFELLTDLNENVTPLGKALRKVKASSVPADLSFPEALFQGIITGVRQTHWGKGRTRALIVIGDHGNHDQDQFAASEVASLLEKERVSLYSINVLRRPKTLQYNHLFVQQLDHILSLSGGVGENFVMPDGLEHDERQAQATLVKLLAKILRFSHNVGNSLRDKSEGKTTKDIESQYGTQVTKYMQRIMREHGLSDQQINLARFSQICIEGWASKYSRQTELPQLEPWLLIDRSSMDEFVGVIAGIYSLARRYTAKGLGNAVKDVIKRASGDSIQQGERISEYLQRRFHIPYNGVSTILNYSPRKLENKFFQDNNFKKKLVKELGKKYALLQSVVEEKDSTLQWDKSKQVWKKLNLTPRKWWWETGSGASFAWVPMEYLP